jgi:hypothetical protein
VIIAVTETNITWLVQYTKLVSKRGVSLQRNASYASLLLFARAKVAQQKSEGA